MSKVDFSLDAVCFFGKWRQNTLNDTCSLCRTSLTMPPQGGRLNDIDVVEGQCGHVFHVFCLDKWKSQGIKGKKNTSCPSDNTEFIEKKRLVSDTDWENNIPRVAE